MRCCVGKWVLCGACGDGDGAGGFHDGVPKGGRAAPADGSFLQDVGTPVVQGGLLCGIEGAVDALAVRCITEAAAMEFKACCWGEWRRQGFLG